MIERLRPLPKEILPIGEGIDYFPKEVRGTYERGLGGVYVGWGEQVSNDNLTPYVEEFLGRKLKDKEILKLSGMGFDSRHHTLHLPWKGQVEAELMVAERTIGRAIELNEWVPGEVDALVIGMTSPIYPEVTVDIARSLGISESAEKVTVHTACDSSMRGLNCVLRNPELKGKKVILGAVEGLSRVMKGSETVKATKDVQALQLFGNGAGFIGVVPGATMEPIVSMATTNYDKDGALQAEVNYQLPKEGYIEKSFDEKLNHTIIAGKVPNTDDGTSVKMANNKGMFKLFVNNTADYIAKGLREHQKITGVSGELNGWSGGVVTHHANYKILLGQSKRLKRIHGITGLNMEDHWIIRDFGNVSAASPMISWLRQADRMQPGTDWLFVGYGAGGHYDVMVVEMGSAENI